MIDTYFDRTDWPSWMNWKSQDFDDSRIFAGSLYSTMIDRNVAEAKANVRSIINNRVSWHRVEIGNGIVLGDPQSVFNADGTFKTQWKTS